jgi:hypothetical protein
MDTLVIMFAILAEPISAMTFCGLSDLAARPLILQGPCQSRMPLQGLSYIVIIVKVMQTLATLDPYKLFCLHAIHNVILSG